MKIRIFEYSTPETLENAINTWLENQPENIEITDTKYQSIGFPASSYAGTDAFATYSVIILYKLL